MLFCGDFLVKRFKYGSFTGDLHFFVSEVSFFCKIVFTLRYKTCEIFLHKSKVQGAPWPPVFTIKPSQN